MVLVNAPDAPIVDVGFLCMIRGDDHELLPAYLDRIAALRDATGWTTDVVEILTPDEARAVAAALIAAADRLSEPTGGE